MYRLFEVLILWALAFFYGALAILGLLRRIYKEGFGKLFGTQKHERPAVLDDPALGTHGFLHLENVRIHYVASGPEDKPLMLFVHGFPEFWYSWRFQIREFQKDYRCVAVDLRGFGDSDKPTDLESYRLPVLAADIKQIISALGYKGCTLVAHDWGGALAWYFARTHADMVDRMVIMNAPPGPVFQEILKTNRQQAKMSWYIFFFQLPYLPEFMMCLGDYEFLSKFGTKEGESLVHPISKEDVEAYKYTYSQSGAWTPPLNYYRAALQLDPVKYDMQFDMPILIIWGMKDKVLSPIIVDETVKHLSKITVKKIPDSGHFVQMDVPETVNQTMREWLSSKE